MTDNNQGGRVDNLNKDPEEWKTGKEPATAAQISYLKTLNEEADENIDFNHLTKAKASELIDSLRKKTGKGK